MARVWRDWGEASWDKARRDEMIRDEAFVASCTAESKAGKRGGEVKAEWRAPVVIERNARLGAIQTTTAPTSSRFATAVDDLSI